MDLCSWSEMFDSATDGGTTRWRQIAAALSSASFSLCWCVAVGSEDQRQSFISACPCSHFHVQWGGDYGDITQTISPPKSIHQLLRNIYLLLPSGNIKYLYFHGEIRSTIPWAVYLFSSFLKTIISLQIKDIYLPFAENTESSGTENTPPHTHTHTYMCPCCHTSRLQWISYFMCFLRQTHKQHLWWRFLSSHLFSSSPLSAGVIAQGWWGFFPACRWSHRIAGPLCPQQSGSLLVLCSLLSR